MPRRPRSSATPLALAWAALVLYASLFPFSGWRWPPGQSVPALLALRWPPWLDRFDDWANFAGYLPLGALLLIAFRRSAVKPLPALLLAAALPSLLSYATEVTQNFLPGRHPSLKDWALNSIGALAGVLVGGALHGLGLIDRWNALRSRWFARDSAGALALLALWPLGLLFPAPLPLGVGQVGPRLRDMLIDALDNVPWADAALEALLDSEPDDVPLAPVAELLAIAFGLLAPCLVAYAVVAPGRRRAALAAGALLVGTVAMTLSTALNFGPDHAFAWLTPPTVPALAAASVVALLLAPLRQRAAAGIGLAVLTGLVVLVAQTPADPYFAQSLQDWERGRFIRFNGIAQWIGWLWPYAAMAWLLGRLAARE